MCMFFGLVLFGGIHSAAAANCQAIIGCHIGTNVATLKAWLSEQLNCNNPSLNGCTGKCDICTDPRVVQLTRAYWAITDGSGCDPELSELIRAQRDMCIQPDCCPSCPAAQFAESYRQCSVPFTDAETVFSSTYLAIAVLVFTTRASTTTSVSLYNGIFNDISQSESKATTGGVYHNPVFTKTKYEPGGLMF